MKSSHPFSGITGGDQLLVALQEVDRLIDEGRPSSPRIDGGGTPEDEVAFERAYERRGRLFGAQWWTLAQALALFIGFVDLRKTLKDDHLRVQLRRFCGPKRDPSAMKAIFDESLESQAQCWIDAVESCRDQLAINTNCMAPLLWMRWVTTYAPSLVTPVFWTEFGLWRNDRFAVSQPMVKGWYDNGASMVCGDSEDFGNVLMPIEAFIHQTMEARDFTASIVVLDVFNGGLLRKGVADYLVSRRSKDAQQVREPSRFEKARRRVGPTAMDVVSRALEALHREQGQALGWISRIDTAGLGLVVPESRDDLAKLVIERAKTQSLGEVTLPVARAALSGLVNFQAGRRRRGI